MAWSPRYAVARRLRRQSPEGRRRRYVEEWDAYLRGCLVSRESRLRDAHKLTAHFIAEVLQPNLMGTFTWPEEVSWWRRRQELPEFLREVFPDGRYVYAWEAHQSGLLHAHAVMRQEGFLRRLSVMDAWTWRTRGYARLEEVASLHAAASYIAKYISKGEQGELEFGPGVKGVPEVGQEPRKGGKEEFHGGGP